MWKTLAMMLCTLSPTVQAQVFPKDRPPVIAADAQTESAAHILQDWLSRYHGVAPRIVGDGKGDIVLTLSRDAPEQGFVTESDGHTIRLTARDVRQLRYAVYTLLETFGFRRFTAAVSYVPETPTLTFPAPYHKISVPSFAWRSPLYPDSYDADFRDWHKLDDFETDFGLWGHTFSRLVPASHFAAHPQWFALYEGERRPESLCMSNDSVAQVLIANLRVEMEKRLDARFFSVSQNDDVVFCECDKCREANERYGGAQGSLYVFLNRVAAAFPRQRIVTLAYLHTYRPPVGLDLAPNLYTLLCPIALDRGKPYAADGGFTALLAAWQRANPRLLVWDYTVQFSHYLSPFPNISHLGANYELMARNGVKGVFAQGYDAVPGDFSELRQYLLAKLLWDATLDVKAVTDDFLRGYYGKAASEIRNYLDALDQARETSTATLDIYSGPVQQRHSFLTPEAMDRYDRLLERATAKAENKAIRQRVLKLRLALEYAYFEQAKFYGKDRHGMFVTQNGKTTVRNGLARRVTAFARRSENMGVSELSEGGPSPAGYLATWKEIASHPLDHAGEGAEVVLRTPPAPDFSGKGPAGLTDGMRGHDDFTINWTGWYGNDADFEVTTEGIRFETVAMHFLEDQRHWIFPPKAVEIYGFTDGNWTLLRRETLPELTEERNIVRHRWRFSDPRLASYPKLRIVLRNHPELPEWRRRKHRSPMLMTDEIELSQPH